MPASQVIPNTRFEWLDLGKGIGILLVAANHVLYNKGLPLIDAIMPYLVLYQMPLFFILSGYLFKADAFPKFALHKVNTLLVPYISYLIVGFLIIQISSILLGTFDFLDTLKLIAKQAYGGNFLRADMAAFWFLSCLFLTQILFCYLINRSTNYKMLAAHIALAAAATSCIAILIPKLHLPWAINLIPVSLAFFGIGVIIRKTKFNPILLTIASFVIILLCLLSSTMLGVHYAMNMKYFVLGPPVLGLLLAAALSWCVLNIYRFFGKSRILRMTFGELGKASLAILCLHTLVSFTMERFGYSNLIIIYIFSIAIPYLFYLIVRRNTITNHLFLGRPDPTLSTIINTQIIKSSSKIPFISTLTAQQA
jgi:fucose 4-O-acetylase-like acetyltransferase